MKRNLIIIGLFATVVVAAVVNSQRSASDPNGYAGDYLWREGERVRTRTAPSGATASTMRGEGDDWTGGVSWTVEGEMGFDVYRDWLKSSLSDYQRMSYSDRDAYFAKLLPGDTHQLWIEAIEFEPFVKVRVLFRASAD